MPERMTMQGWLLILIVLCARAPTRYVYRYLAHAPARRDITQASEDLSWRTARSFALSVSALLALAALAVFIFTPAAAQFASGPYFAPLLCAAIGAFGLGTVARGLSTGRIEPLTRGTPFSFERRSQPKSFWGSMAWNLSLSCGMFWAAAGTLDLTRTRALESQCHDSKSALPPQEIISACSHLIDAASEDDRALADLVANRAGAYFRAKEYKRAKADYARIVRLSPDNAAAHYNLGVTDELTGDMDGAIAHFSEVIRRHPDDVDAYSRRGVLLLERRHFDRAIADFTRVHALHPDDPWPLARRADAYDQLGEREKMEADDAEALRLSETEQRARQ